MKFLNTELARILYRQGHLSARLHLYDNISNAWLEFREMGYTKTAAVEMTEKKFKVSRATIYRARADIRELSQVLEVSQV